MTCGAHSMLMARDVGPDREYVCESVRSEQVRHLAVFVAVLFDQAGIRGRRRGACSRLQAGHFRFSHVRDRIPGR